MPIVLVFLPQPQPHTLLLLVAMPLVHKHSRPLCAKLAGMDGVAEIAVWKLDTQWKAAVLDRVDLDRVDLDIADLDRVDHAVRHLIVPVKLDLNCRNLAADPGDSTAYLLELTQYNLGLSMDEDGTSKKAVGLVLVLLFLRSGVHLVEFGTMEGDGP